jgi:regulatory helix-turn-helix AraC family protein
METEIETTVAEVKRLKACISDLISVLAVPAISIGGEPRQIIGALLDGLLGMLRLDFLYAECKNSTGGTPIVLVRTPRSGKPTVLPQEVGQAIDAWLEDRSQASPFVVKSPAGGEDISVASLRLGLQHEIGWLLAGSRRADFPTQTERLLLGVAANQAAIGVQDARLLSEQKHAAKVLDRKVAQRTRELQAANQELKRALKEIDELKDKLQRENVVLREEVAGTRGGLAPWQLRRATELMNARLDGRLPLTRLAGECGLSVRHFARAFRQSTGMPPHR